MLMKSYDLNEAMISYPQYHDDKGNIYTLIGWGVSLCNGIEWYAFEKYKQDEYFGLVHGPRERVMRRFSIKEIDDVAGSFFTEPEELSEIKPPEIKGWGMARMPRSCRSIM
jgi:hypothetical protein